MDKSQIFYQPLKHSPKGGAGRGLLLLAFLFLASCTKTDPDTFSHESVQQAAQHYYTYFVNGDAKHFVEGMAGADMFPEDYKEQMQSVITQAAKELAKKSEVVRVEALSDSLYVADSTALVFLDLVFADSIHEQVGVPMVFKKSKWRVK
ncbi:MAG: hypothetical protein J6W21_09380 [Bacteroidaceae bacterium]|nr:hypothetical protein [Bacteroidaceae bacterium]